MFKNNFVTSIKSNGKFFKENENNINIPFNTEYSIYLKNLESRDAVVNVSIDGKDVLDGKRLIVRGNSVLELEGFMDGQMAKNKFKFIKRSKEIEDFLGITPEDGIISVTFDFEKRKPDYYPYVFYYPDWRWYPQQPYYYGSPTWTIATYESTTGTYTTVDNPVTFTNTSQSRRGSSNSVMSMNAQVSEGISVSGNDISQNFGLGYVGNLENNPTTISFKLFGFDSSEEKQVVFSKDKTQCKTCGLENKNQNKFCGRCGTRLNNE